jgi:hypothetical protein
MTIKTEKDLFDIWVKASIEDSKIESEKDIVVINDFWEAFYELISKGYFYDPNTRYFTEFLEGIDIIPDKLWYLYRPLADYPKHSFVRDLSELKSRNNKLLRNYEIYKIGEPVDNLIKKYSLKRYYNSFIKKVAIISHNEPTIKINSLKNKNVEVTYYIYESHKINEKLYESLQDNYDLIVISTNSRSEIILDDFIPAYPLFLYNDVLIMTPILLQQTNGCDESNIMKSFKNRIINIFGVTLIDSKMSKDSMFEQNIEKESLLQGISDYQTETVLKDGRIQKLNPDFSKHISFNGHGWASQYTQSNLISALRTIKPKVILELGVWYGLSTRLISYYNPVKDCKIYCADFYKNSAIPEKEYKKLYPSDKFYKNHQKYETFYANLSGRISENDLTQRFYFDKVDTNKSKEVYVMKMDAYEAIEIAKTNNLEPDLIYVDFVKNTKELTQVLKKLRDYFPTASIVGDDYVYDRVKKAVSNANLKYTWNFTESYAIIPDKNIYLKFRNNVKKYYNSIKKIDKINRKNALTHPYEKLAPPYQDGVMLIQYLRTNVSDIEILESIDYKVPFSNLANETPFDIVKFKTEKSFL